MRAVLALVGQRKKRPPAHIPALACAVALLLGGCAAHVAKLRSQAVVTVEAQPETGWRTIATADDQHVIDNIAKDWAAARARASVRYPTRLRQEGALLDPAAALPLPAMPPGPYRCRLVRLGGEASYVSYRPDFCFIMGDSDAVSLTKQDGQTLPGGWLYSDDVKTRLVFLGTNRKNAGDIAPAYGTVPGRSMIGLVERIGDFRWRLVVARGGDATAGTGGIDVYDLTPVLVDNDQALKPTNHEVGLRRGKGARS